MSYIRKTQHTHQSQSETLAAQIRQAVSLHTRGQLPEAEALYREVLRRQPDHFDATHLLGVIAMQRSQSRPAIELLSKAVSLNPRQPQALANLGSALLRANRPDEALGHYERALQLDPNFTGALSNYGSALQTLGRHEEAAGALGRLVQMAPDFDYALGSLFQSRRHCADWRDFQSHAAATIDAVSTGKRVDRPFSFLSVSGSAARQLECARTYMSHLYPPSQFPLWRGERYGHDKIRVAYVSADFRAHAVANHMAALYERHDPREFHTIGISLLADDGAEVVLRAKRCLARFVDASAMSDEAVAQSIRELEVDIVVDLTGYTLGCRPGIFARRPAPVQVNFLGFPGTMGAPYIDYLIADEFVCPPSSASLYAEHIVRMPHSFQINDERRSELLNTPTPSRTEVGLPDGGFVFCTFNNTYKLNPMCLDSWARILKQVPQSVLWLLGETPEVRERLCSEVAARGIEPGRLAFAVRMPYAAHLARLRLADLFLDSLPFNAGATASDALWAAVPLLTCSADAFAARMGGSLLRALGLPELITTSTTGYEQRAIELARDRERLASIKSELAANRATHPLFNTEIYCRHLESAYRHMWSRAEAGKPPAAFTVPTTD
jgi:protein O-GlcNAc transferase